MNVIHWLVLWKLISLEQFAGGAQRQLPPLEELPTRGAHTLAHLASPALIPVTGLPPVALGFITLPLVLFLSPVGNRRPRGDN